MAKVRADQLLVTRGLFESRARAQAAIEAGLVSAGGEQVRKLSQELREDVDLVAEPAHPYVSRGGVKLASALAHFDFDPSGKICVDVGASTGGFTDVLLRGGARRVYAVDVGTGQLHPSLTGHPDVVQLEKVDARTRPFAYSRTGRTHHDRCEFHFTKIDRSWSREYRCAGRRTDCAR
jgi:23S rRNA (cytidine1920-2'-O)/16S rRNA (cytidine1409-2'-O)-methyltransferase